MACHGIALSPWHVLKSERSPILGTVRPRPARPCGPRGFGVQYDFVRATSNSSFSSPFCRRLCRANPFICFWGAAEGFVSFPVFISIPVFPYVSGGGYCSVLPSS